MIEEAYVSFEVAKLLKEKGFEEPCFKFYTQQEELGDWQYHPRSNKEPFLVHKYSAPTQQMAMRWLREVHGVVAEVVVRHNDNLGGLPLFEYRWDAYRGFKHIVGNKYYYEYYEEAAEAAIKYCLENLIKKED